MAKKPFIQKNFMQVVCEQYEKAALPLGWDLWKQFVHINMIQIEGGTNNAEQFISAVKPLALNCSWIWISVQKQNSSQSNFSLFCLRYPQMSALVLKCAVCTFFHTVEEKISTTLKKLNLFWLCKLTQEMKELAIKPQSLLCLHFNFY